MCLIFPHDRLHCGDALLTGRKYLMRTDAMYLCRGTAPAVLTGGAPAAAVDSYGDEPAPADEVDEVFIQAAALLAQAEQHERDGQLTEAVALYRRAYKMCPRLDPTGHYASS
jgi:hypothetical protein